MTLPRIATICVIGGCTAIRENGALKSIESIEVDARSEAPGERLKRIETKTMGPLQIARRAPSVMKMSNGSILVAGGCSGPGAHEGSIEIVCGTESTSFDSLLPPHSCAASSSIDPDELLIVGGYDGFECLNQVSLVNVANNKQSVTRLPTFGSPLKNGAMVNGGNGELLIFGGWDGTRTMKSIFRMKLAGKDASLEMCGILPHPSEGHSANRHQNSVFIVGGYDGYAVTDRIVRFDTTNSTAKVLNVKLEVARENHTAQIIGNFLVVLGGWDGHNALDSIEVCRMARDLQWNPMSDRKSSPDLLLTELTSLDELSFPSSSRRIRYTCVAVSQRYLIVGTCSGTVYVFSRYASRHRSKLASLPVSILTIRDGSVNKLLISPSETHVAVGSESGRISVAALGPASANASPAPALVYTVPGDVRRPDRVTALCWAAQGDVLFAGHFTGRVVQHKISSRSLFRTVYEQVAQFDGPIVQVSYSMGRLLISGNSSTFLVPLDTRESVQVGTKVRNELMGGCFGGPDGDDAFIIAARPHGRLWEANLVGTVYRLVI
ncbi:unnamed protein product, partial [Mesorhabditis spiculigera]